MAIDKNSLIKDWIQYLKNNRIVALQSDPKSGKLNYKQPVTRDILIKFIKFNTDLDDKTINNAVSKILGNKPVQQSDQNKSNQQKPGTAVTTQQQGTQPGTAVSTQKPGTSFAPQNAYGSVSTQVRQPTQAQNAQSQQPKKSKYNKDDAEDIKYKDVKEDIVDDPGPKIDEKDVEAIFDLLATASPAAPEEPEQQTSGTQAQQTQSQPTPAGTEDLEAKKQQDLKKLTTVIATTMTDGQRKAFWRALHES